MHAAALIDIAEEYARALHDLLGDNLVRVSLFGSRARSEHRPDSDFDLMVGVREADGGVRSAVHTLALDFELDRALDLSTKILRASDFEKLRASSHPFWRRFRQDERLLWPRTS